MIAPVAVPPVGTGNGNGTCEFRSIAVAIVALGAAVYRLLSRSVVVILAQAQSWRTTLRSEHWSREP
jgi:hypothetical protein